MNPRLRAEWVGERTVSGVSANVVLDVLMSCFGDPISRNSVLEGLRASMFKDIQFEIDWNAVRRDEMAFDRSWGLMEM